jgi:hypothetical protein
MRRKLAHFVDFRPASRSLLRGLIRTLRSRQGTVGSCDARERGLGAGMEAGRGSGRARILGGAVRLLWGFGRGRAAADVSREGRLSGGFAMQVGGDAFF